jgi:HlyD family secretion protein
MEVKQARAAIKDAKANLAEDQELYAVLNGQPMPEETSNESLLAIKEAKSNMDQAKARLDGTQIIAPFAGTIMQVNIAGGDTVAVGSTDNNVIDATKAIVIDDTSDPYLEVYWNESDWSMVKLGKVVEITFDDLSDQVYSGTITEVDSRLAVSNGSNVVRGEVSLNASYADLSLPIGATATVEAVNQRADNAVFIPIEALHEYSSGEYAVFVLTDGEPAIRTVEVGLKTAEYAQITSGLEAGEVVTTGITKTK